jgi:hypothetical protein
MTTEIESLQEVFRKATAIADAAHTADRTAWLTYEAARNANKVISELPNELTPQQIEDIKKASAFALIQAQAAYEIASSASKNATEAAEAARQAIILLTG